MLNFYINKKNIVPMSYIKKTSTYTPSCRFCCMILDLAVFKKCLIFLDILDIKIKFRIHAGDFKTKFKKQKKNI